MSITHTFLNTFWDSQASLQTVEHYQLKINFRFYISIHSFANQRSKNKNSTCLYNNKLLQHIVLLKRGKQHLRTPAISSVAMFYLYNKYAYTYFSCIFISPSGMTHLLRISSKHGVYGFDPLEQVGWDHIGRSAMWEKTACLTVLYYKISSI